MTITMFFACWWAMQVQRTQPLKLECEQPRSGYTVTPNGMAIIFDTEGKPHTMELACKPEIFAARVVACVRDSK